MKNKNYQKIILGIIAFLIIVLIMTFIFPSKKENELVTNDPNISITGKITDKTAALAAFDTMEKNLAASNKEDIESYTSTIVPSAREETKKELATFFEDYDLENTLLTFEVKKQEEDHLLVETTQQTVNKGKKEYKDHIATTSVTFVKEEDQWLIEQSVVTDTKFI